MTALPPLMTLLGIHALPVVNAVACSLKLTALSRAERILTMKIIFDPATDLIRIRSIKIGFDFDSVLESVRTLVYNTYGRPSEGIYVTVMLCIFTSRNMEDGSCEYEIIAGCMSQIMAMQDIGSHMDKTENRN